MKLLALLGVPLALLLALVTFLGIFNALAVVAGGIFLLAAALRGTRSRPASGKSGPVVGFFHPYWYAHPPLPRRFAFTILLSLATVPDVVLIVMQHASNSKHPPSISMTARLLGCSPCTFYISFLQLERV